MKRLLWCGVAAGALFVVVFLVEGALRGGGYDPLRHPVSSLGIGDRGWVQAASFIVAGTLTLVFFAAHWWLTRTWRSFLFAVWGVSLIAAGVFTGDPVSGYPVGTPAIPDPPTVSGALHDNLSLPGFIALAVGMIAFARRGTLPVSLGCFVVFAAGIIVSSLGFAQLEPWLRWAGLWQRVAVVVAWGWVAAMAIGAIRHTRAASS